MPTRRTSTSKGSSTAKRTPKSASKRTPKREVRSPFRSMLPLAVTLIIGLGMVLVYVSLDAQIEVQAKKVVEVEEEINKAHNEYSAQLNDWQHTLQPSNLIRLMTNRDVDMHFPEPRERIVMSNHDVWIRRQTAKASVRFEPLPQAAPPAPRAPRKVAQRTEATPSPREARAFEVVPATRYIRTEPDAEPTGELRAPPPWARPFLNARP